MKILSPFTQPLIALNLNDFLPWNTKKDVLINVSRIFVHTMEVTIHQMCLVSFCVLQKKLSHSSLEQEYEQIEKMLLLGTLWVTFLRHLMWAKTNLHVLI